MKYLHMFIISLTLVSCATSEFGKRKAAQDEINENLLKQDQLVGEMPSWVNGEGLNGGFIYAVGEAEYGASYRPQLVKSAAEHNAKMRIVSRLPADYTYIVQNALSSASQGEFNQVEISRGDLYGLQGVEVKRKYTTCAKIIRHTDFGSSVNRICWSQASVPVKHLNDAVVRTIKLKYGEDTASKFEKLLEEQLQNSLKGGYSEQRMYNRGIQDNNPSNATSEARGTGRIKEERFNESLQRRTGVTNKRVAKSN